MEKKEQEEQEDHISHREHSLADCFFNETPYMEEGIPVEGLSLYTIKDANGDELLSLIDFSGQNILEALNGKDLYDYLPEDKFNDDLL